MKNDYDISKQFQDDLIKAYNKAAPTSWTQEEAYRKAVKMPAPRYYITPKQALQVLSPMIRGDFEKVELMMPNKRRQYYSLYHKVIELSEKRAFIGKSLSYIVQYAVACPAPEFFVTHHVLAQVRSFLKNGHFDDDGKVLNIKSRVKAYEALKKRRKELREYRAQFKKKTP